MFDVMDTSFWLVDGVVTEEVILEQSRVNRIYKGFFLYALDML